MQAPEITAAIRCAEVPWQAQFPASRPVVEAPHHQRRRTFAASVSSVGPGPSGGWVTDCDGYLVEGAIATASSTPASPTHLPGAETYYFSAGSTSLPVRLSQQAYTNKDGLFVVIELPPGPDVYLQVWAYITPGDVSVDNLTLLSEVPFDVFGDSYINANMDPAE